MIAIRVRTREQAVAASGLGALAAGLFLWLMMATGAAAQQPGGYADGGEWDDYRVSARVWLDRGQEPLVERGDRVRVFYRTSADAYVAIFHIDTNGTTRLVHPRSPEENHWVRGNRDYRLLFPRSPFWYVDDHPGVGYYFIVASPEPFDFSLLDYSYYDGGWDLHQVGRNVYSDPYVAMDDYVAALVPDWERVPYALDFASYNVGQERYDYPRFLCYDCHDFRSFDSWNPYHYACTSFRVVIYDDPYYYPAYRYRGDRVVYVRPPVRRLPRFDFKERAEDEPPAPLLATRASNGTVTPRPGVPGDVARRTPSGVGSGGEGSGESTGGREAVQRSGAEGGVSAGTSGDVRRRDGSGGSAGSTGGAGATGSDEAGSRLDALRRRGDGVIDATGGGASGGGSAAGDAGARDGRGGSAAGDAARWGSSSRRIVVPRRTDEANETRERRFVPVIPRSGDEAVGGTSGSSGAEAGRAGESGTADESRGSILRRFIPAARSGEERGRPVLERRPTTKAGVGTRGEGGSSGAVESRGSGSGGDVGRAGGVIRRPTERVRGSSGAGNSGSSGSAGDVIRRSGGSGSSGGSVRPPVRIRSGGATGSSGSSGGAVRRSGGSGSSGGNVRPPVRIRSGGATGSSGGEVRRSGGGSSGGDVSKPPVRIRRSGSGGF